MIEYFEQYTSIGLQVIPLYPSSKIPIGKEWNIWDHKRSRIVFEQIPNANIGILLGEIVDVEGDTEEANELLLSLIDCPHPSYISSRSIHHLFINPDPDLTVFKFQDVEFRAHKHQSVLPPSKHEDGTSYSWTKDNVFIIPPMPESLLNFYKLHSGFKKKPFLKPGHIKPWCSICNNRKPMHEKRYKLEKEAFTFLGCKWACHKCRKFDIRELCRKIKYPIQNTCHKD